jgi:hypothetical protein
MTTRRWMISVAIVALVIAWGIHRRDSFRRLAEWHRSQTFPSNQDLSVRVSWDSASETRRWWVDKNGNLWLSDQQVRENSWHRRMEAKYRHATCYPWLSVEPDPPPEAVNGGP